MAMKPVDTAIAVVVGPLIDDTDFKTAETAVAYDAAGMSLTAVLERADGIVTVTQITPTGSTGGVYNWDHLGAGYYQLDLPASGGAHYNNDTEGVLRVVGSATGVLPFSSVAYDITAKQAYDSMVSGSDKLEVDIAQWRGSTPAVLADTDKVNVYVGNKGVLNDLAAGAEMALTSAYDAAKTAAQAAVCTEIRLAELDAGNLPTDVAAVKTQTDAIETDTQDLQTQIGTDGAGLTAIGDARLANLDAAVSTRLATAGYTAPISAAVIADAVWDESLADHQQSASAGNALDSATAPTADEVADAVWEEAISDHSGTTGSTAEALNAAGSAGDPWTTQLPGAYGIGSAGKIVGDNLNTTVSSRSSHSADDVKTAIEAAGSSVAAIKAKTDNLPASPAATGAAMTLTPEYDAAKAAAQASVCTEARLAELDAANLPADIAAVKAQTAAIETDTQDLQAQVGVGGAGLTAIGDTRLTNLDATVSSRLATTGYTAPDNAGIANVLAAVDTEVASVLAAVDTEVAAIKAKTDNLPVSPAAVGSAMELTATAVDAIWDEVLIGLTHNVTNSAGKRLRELSGQVIHSGVAAGPGTGGNQIVLGAFASGVTGAYDPSVIAIVLGTGAGQCRMIYQYDGPSKTATVDRNWKVPPSTDSEYIICAHPGREHINEGLAQAGSSNTITLNSLASDADDAYTHQTVYIRSGTGHDQVNTVIAYNGTSKVATVESAWDVVPDVTSGYVILPFPRILASEITALIAASTVGLATDANMTELLSMTENTSAGRQFTEHALELAPSSTIEGGDASAANQALILADLEEIKGTGFVPDTNSLVNVTGAAPVTLQIESEVTV